MADGYSDNEIRGLRRRGSWATLRRGGYLAPASAPLDGYERHLMLIDATLAGLHRPAVVSHVSAAVLHGMALWAVHLGTMHVTRVPPASRGRSTSMLCHAAVLDEQDVVQVRGRPVTSAARTVVDVARMVPFEQAVVTADSALWRGLTTSAELADTVRRMSGITGLRAARRAVAFADARSESVGESRSRVLLRQAGVPAPDLQVEVLGESGDLLGRSDFGWVGGRVLGEFDGRMNTAGSFGPAKRLVTRCTGRSVARTRSGQPVRWSSAGRGTTSPGRPRWSPGSAAPSQSASAAFERGWPRGRRPPVALHVASAALSRLERATNTDTPPSVPNNVAEQCHLPWRTTTFGLHH